MAQSHINSSPPKPPKFRKAEVLTGENIILERTTIADSDDLYPLINDPIVNQNLTMGPMAKKEWFKYLRFSEAQWKMNNDFSYTAKLFPDQKVIGQVSLYHISFLHYRAELGIWIGQKYQNRGYGTEMLQLIIDYAFSNLKINRLQAHIFIFNQASIRLFEKLGFKREGQLREYVKKDGRFLDVYIYSMLKEDWIP